LNVIRNEADIRNSVKVACLEVDKEILTEALMEIARSSTCDWSSQRAIYGLSKLGIDISEVVT
jgi:hypothetical protein